jgi:hypothetical protein
MQCPTCQQENSTSHEFCRECGTSLGRPTMSGSPGPSYADLERALSEAPQQQTATAERTTRASSASTEITCASMLTMARSPSPMGSPR